MPRLPFPRSPLCILAMNLVYGEVVFRYFASWNNVTIYALRSPDILEVPKRFIR